MRIRSTMIFSISLGLTVGAHALNVTGNVTNKTGKAIVNAVVTLVKQGMKDTTGVDGNYAFVSTGIARDLSGKVRNIGIDDGVLEISLVQPTPLKVDVFDTKGTLLKSEQATAASAGVYRMDVRSIAKGNRILLVKVAFEGNGVVLRYAALGSSGAVAANSVAPRLMQASGRAAAVSDTVKVEAKGYVSKAIPTSSLDTTINVVLDTLDNSRGIPFHNPAEPSSGCGKSSTVFKTGTNTYSMTSASLKREYTLSVPSNYDKSKPYKLVFGMHWMGGNMGAVNSEQWYHLMPLDVDKNIIWAAPQGYTDGSPWRGMENNDDKDHVFFDELQAKIKSELCVDTTRVFSIGFSFGAMYTNSLAQRHQNIFRAVVVFATADYNIYFPTNTGEPLAYMGTVGLGDGTCPPKTGRSSKDRFVKNNKCTVPATVPETTTGSGSHVVYDYQDCGYHPVKWCTFDGGHDDYPKDRNQSTTWVTPIVWQFISQF